MNDITPATTSTITPSDDHDIVEAVVSAVADAEDVSLLDLEPLAAAIDPEALGAVLESMDSWTEAATGSVEFPYSGYLVTVTGDGDVSLSEIHALD